MTNEERMERAQVWDSRTPKERFNSLTQQEQTAFCAFFCGGRNPQLAWRADTEKLTPIKFGKAECEWVSYDFWRYKLPGLRFITYLESAPKPALGMAPGSVFIEVSITVTDDGFDAYETAYQD